MLPPKEMKFLKYYASPDRKWILRFFYLLSICLVCLGLVNLYNVQMIIDNVGITWQRVFELSSLQDVAKIYHGYEVFAAVTYRKAIQYFGMAILFLGFPHVLKKQRRYYDLLLKYMQKYPKP
jgi:hypothetical protein